MTTTDAAIHKTLELTCPAAHAFGVFTDRIADWWPLETHSICEDPQASVAFEDGLLVETTPGGERHEWADVLTWEPPHRLVLNWRVNPERADTHLEVTFTDLPGGGSRLDLRHSGFDDPARAEAYTAGWSPVLEAFSAGARVT